MKRLLAVAAVASLPVGKLLFDFFNGLHGAEAMRVVSNLFFLFVGPFLPAIVLPRVVLTRSHSGVQKFVMGVATYLLTASFAFLPPSSLSWTHGFAVALKTKTNLDELQSWATSTLKRHDNQIREMDYTGTKLCTMIKIPRNELPSFLCEGIFRPGRVWPAISISGVEAGKVCVAISWYKHGILVGLPEFTTSWDPEYIRLIRPGVYIYLTHKY